MAKRRGNPNWGKPEPIGPVVPTVTSFEQVVKEFKLTPDQYIRSTRLREWARRNKNSKYIAEVAEAVAEIRAGRMVVVVDDEDRENEGDLTLAAEFVTPEAINFMARFGRGLICLTLTEERADYLRLGPLPQENTSRFGTAFTESIEAREGVTTGISAYDPAHTICVAIDPRSTAQD